MTSRVAALLGALALIGLAACESPRMNRTDVEGNPLHGNLPTSARAACAIAPVASMEAWSTAIRWSNQPGRPHAFPLHGPTYVRAAERHLRHCLRKID